MSKIKSYYVKHVDGTCPQANAEKRGVIALLNLVDYPLDFMESFAEEVQACVNHMYNVFTSLKSDKDAEDWIEAAKGHKDKIAEICTQMFQISKTNGVANPIASVEPSKITFYDGFSLEELSIRPRSFWRCYKLLRFISYCQNAVQLQLALQIIVCIFTFYKDIGVQGPKLDELAMQHINEQKSSKLKDSATTNLNETVVKDFLTHMDNCVNGVEQPRTEAAKTLLATLRIAKQKFTRPSQSRDEIPVNTHSSGLSVDGLGTMPAILASAFEKIHMDEYDNTAFDKIANYKRDPLEIKISKSHVRLTRSVFIANRSKADVREIHTASCYIQDRLNFHAKIMKNYLRNRYSIVIWDQMKGVIRTCKYFRRSNCKAVYSLDLHAATDTFDVMLQATVYRYVLKWTTDYSDEEIEIIVAHWLHYMTMELHALLPYSKKQIKYHMSTGQPMGLESSIYSFNESHDMIVTALVDYCERVLDLEARGWSILGDDFVIGFKRDKEFLFPKLYKDLLQEYNTECNLSKGYIFNDDHPDYRIPLAEFAKNLICDGVNITPIPLGALHICDTEQGIYSLLAWYREHMSIPQIDLDKVVFVDDSNRDLIALLSCMPIDNQFRALVWGDQKPLFRQKDDIVLLCVALGYIREFLMLKIMNEVCNDPDYIPKSTDFNSFQKKWRRYARMILKPNIRSQLPNNKFVALADRMELVAMAQGYSVDKIMKGMFPAMSPDDSILELLPSLKKISDSDLGNLMFIFDTMNEIDSIEDIDEIQELYIEDHRIIMSLISSLRKLTLADFNPTAQRFGVQKNKITAGIDFSRIRKDSMKYFRKFHVTEDDIEDTLNYLKDISRSKFCYTWNTSTVNALLLEDDDSNDDVWSKLGIDLDF